MSLRLAYYPGCTLKTNARNYEISAVASSKALGIELVELPRWNCCGTVHALAKDDVMHYIAPVRNLIRVEQLKSSGLVDDERLVTLCEMCYNTLKRADVTVKEDEERRRKLREVMEEEPPYSGGGVEVIHLLQLIREVGWERVKKRLVRPLRRLRVAPYYGCLLLRPKGIGIDDANNPTTFERLIESLGAEVVEIPFKAKCCGSYQTVHMAHVASELSYRILRQAVEGGADVMTLACPLCEYNLGERQGEIEGLFPDLKYIPVLYFTQLMALAFGLEGSVGLEMNNPDPRPLLRRKGFLREA